MWVFWLYRYHLDKDVSVIEGRYYFDDPDDVFPVMSLCFEQPFNDNLFQKFGKNISGSDYQNFLLGNYFNSEMTKIDYNSVTTNISNFVLSYEVKFQNGSSFEDTMTNIGWEKLYYTLSSHNFDLWSKCFGLEITNKDVYYVTVFVKREIFPGRIRGNDGSFAVRFHYPNQVLASMQTLKRQWPKINDSSTNYYMSFNLKGLDVNENRYKKRQNNFILNWKNYDNITSENHLNKVGCKTPDQICSEEWPICTNQGKMNEARLRLGRTRVHPCKEVEYVYYDFGITEDSSVKTFRGQYWNNWIGFVYRILHPRFRVTVQKKEVDFQALIGYIGGYIGIFTGFAIINIPDLIFSASKVAKKLILSYHNQNTKTSLPLNSEEFNRESV